MPSDERPGSGALPPAVVVGLDSITGLQTARILARHSVPVIGVVADRRHWGARTNACVEILESPLSGPGLVSTLLELGARNDRRGVLLPCTDASVDTLSRERGRLRDMWTLPLSDHAGVDLLMDKTRFAAHAAASGLPVPRTELLGDSRDAQRVAATMEFPCVIKPPFKSPTWLARTAAKGFMVRDAAELLSTYERVSSWSPVLLAQAWVEGTEDELYSVNAYFGEGGEPLATFVARKVRQWPPGIGTSASGEECRNDEVLECALRLFGAVRFRGLAYLEMKRDRRTGRLVIIEPNVGRPTGRSAIAEAGGVELVHTAYCDALGLPLPEDRRQTYAGTKWVDVRRDLQAAVLAHRAGTLTAADWLRWMRGPKAHAIWSRQDPKPFAVDLVRATATGVRAMRARRHPVEDAAASSGSEAAGGSGRQRDLSDPLARATRSY